MPLSIVIVGGPCPELCGSANAEDKKRQTIVADLVSMVKYSANESDHLHEGTYTTED